MFVPIAASHSFPTSEFTIVATSRNGYKLSEKRYRVWIIKNGMNNEWSELTSVAFAQLKFFLLFFQFILTMDL